MSDWSDVMEARRDADDALTNADIYGGSIEDGRDSDPALATLLAARAVCLELRAHAIALDHASTR